MMHGVESRPGPIEHVEDSWQEAFTAGCERLGMPGPMETQPYVLRVVDSDDKIHWSAPRAPAKKGLQKSPDGVPLLGKGTSNPVAALLAKCEEHLTEMMTELEYTKRRAQAAEAQLSKMKESAENSAFLKDMQQQIVKLSTIQTAKHPTPRKPLKIQATITIMALCPTMACPCQMPPMNAFTRALAMCWRERCCQRLASKCVMLLIMCRSPWHPRALPKVNPCPVARSTSATNRSVCGFHDRRT